MLLLPLAELYKPIAHTVRFDNFQDSFEVHANVTTKTFCHVTLPENRLADLLPLQGGGGRC